MLSMTAPEHIALPSVSASAMLVELSFSFWAGRKKDKRAEEQMARHYGASESAVNASKALLGNCPELHAIQKYKAQVQTGYHYGMTLPFTDSGLRLLPTAHFMDYHHGITERQARYDDLVEQFLERYEWYAAEAQAQLGGLFARDEYPTADSLRSKFAMRVNYLPLPESGDFRVDVGDQAVAMLRNHYDRHYGEMLERAANDVWKRTHDALTRLVKSLDVDADGKRGRIYESTFDSVRDLIDTMKSFNLNNDPSMEAARQKLEAALHGVGLEALKEDESVRNDTRRNLQQVLSSLPSLDM